MDAEDGERARLVCRCAGLSDRGLRALARRTGARRVEQVAALCGAGAACETCHPELEEVLAGVRGEPVDPGLRLDNRRTCRAETRARVVQALEEGVIPALAADELWLDGFALDGLRVRLRLSRRARPEDYARVEAWLRERVSPELEVEPLARPPRRPRRGPPVEPAR